jgi:hypothetical protein
VSSISIFVILPHRWLADGSQRDASVTKASMPSMMRCRPNRKERDGSWAAPYSAPASRADADRRGVAGRVEDFGEQGTVGLPPLLVGDAGASMGFGGLDGASRSAADVVVEKADDEVHVDVGEAEAVHGGEFCVIKGGQAGAEQRPAGRDLQQPRVGEQERPMPFGEGPSRPSVPNHFLAAVIAGPRRVPDSSSGRATFSSAASPGPADRTGTRTRTFTGAAHCAGHRSACPAAARRTRPAPARGPGCPPGSAARWTCPIRSAP